jgi:CubicO group peptidase (beta-lactamase class C family)
MAFEAWGRRLADDTLKEAPGVAVMVGRAAVGGEERATLLRTEQGIADVSERLPVGPDTIFRIFSLTKVIVSAAALPLIERGTIALDDSIELWLSQFSKMQVWQGDEAGSTAAATRGICIRDLLRHTAGMYYPDRPDNGTPGVGSAALTEKFDSSGVRAAFTLEEQLLRLAQLPLAAEPSTRFTYSVSTLVLARLIECVSGESLESYLDRTLFSPLGMVDTGFFLRDDGQRARLANLYFAREDGYDEVPQTKKIFTYDRAAGKGPNADGGIFSTMDDVARFLEFLMSDGRGARAQDSRY